MVFYLDWMSEFKEKLSKSLSQGLKDKIISRKEIKVEKCPVGIHKLFEQWVKEKHDKTEDISLAYSKDVNDEVLNYLFKEFKSLKTLDLTQTGCFTSSPFSKNKNEIETLILDSCGEIGESNMELHRQNHLFQHVKFRFTPPILMKVFEKSGSNEKIVKNILSFYSEMHVQHKELVEIIKNCPKLRVLSAKWLLWMTECTFRQLIYHGKNLEILNLSHCNNAVSEDTIVHISTMHRFIGIGVNFCRDFTDSALEAVCHEDLEFLEIASCKKLTKEGLIKAFKKCKNLKALDLSLLSIVDDEVLEELSHCKFLKTLDIQGDKAIKSLKSIIPLENLEYLNLVNIPNIDIKDLKDLKNLKNLSMKDLDITDDILLPILKSNLKLEKLHVSDCTKITDKSIDYISSIKGHPLKDIDISGCTQITEATIFWLVQQLTLDRLTILVDGKVITETTASQLKMLKKTLNVNKVYKK